MKAMLLRIVSLRETETPLDLVEMPMPAPAAGELLIKVSACGVCHTELDEIEGRTAPPRLPIVLGHEVVGRVERLGEGATVHRVGDRVGVGWIHSSSGDRDENLSPQFRATGRDAHGGYAECMTVPERLHAIIDTTPAWEPVVRAMGNLRPGGRLVINAIRKEEADKQRLLDLSYHEHLWLEREIKTVANITGDDIREFLPLAAEIPIRPEVQTYPLAEANRALLELKAGQVRGAKVLVINEEEGLGV